MANPVPVTYNAAASPIAGGRFVWPAWRRGRAPMSVFAIPASNTLSDVDPRYDPSLNPVYPSKPEWAAAGDQSAIINAWCGACYGDEVGEFWLPLSGGHADYAGNEPYKINLRADTPQWEMVRPPSGAIGNLLITKDSQESTGMYSDGRPRAIHSYNKPVWIPNVGPSISVQGNCSWSGQAGVYDFLLYDRQTGEAIRKPHLNPGLSHMSGGGACYDTVRHSIWAFGLGTGKMCRYDISENTWIAETGWIASAGEVGMCYIPDIDCLFVATESFTANCWLFDCTTKTRHAITTTGQGALTLTGKSCPRWVPELNAVAVWHNTSGNEHKVTLYTPTDNPKTEPWVVSVLTFNIVDQPTPAVGQGTYGRFFYSSRLGGFGVLNGTTQPIYFFALR